jgi:hypothetical protein
MSDTRGSDPNDEQPGSGDDRPPAYPPSQGQPYGEPQQPFGAPPPSPSPYGQQHQGQHQGQQQGQQPPAQPQSYTQQYGQSNSQQYGQPAQGAYPSYGEQALDKRPATVTTAGVITLVTSGLMFVLLAVSLVTVLAAGPDSDYVQDIVDEMAQQNAAYEDFSAQTIVNIAAVGVAIALGWAVIAMVLAIFAMRRSNAARIGLVVSAALVCVPTGLVGLAGAFLMLLLSAACIVVIICLFAGGAGGWYARRHGHQARSGGLAPPIA